jgi:hypothetical protein
MVFRVSSQPGGHWQARRLVSEQCLVRREPARAAGRYLPERFVVAADGVGKLVEGKPSVAVSIRTAHQESGEARGLACAVSDRILGEAQRDQAGQLALRQRAVAVDVVNSKCEEQPVAGAAREQPADAAEKIGGIHVAVTVAVERGEQAPGELFAVDSQRSRELRDTD